MVKEPPISREQAQALLSWYAEMGVDEAVGDVPVDRFAAPQAAAPAPAAAPVAAPAASPPRQVSDPILLARSRAASAQTLEELQEILAGFESCPLRFTAKNLVFADGNPQARIMLVGEAPGAEEDIQGKPFVGRAGQLLDRMLAAISLDRQSAYIANVIYWRPPGNRTPTPEELEICRPFIARQIALADPEILVLLGNASARQLLGRPEGILRMRGRWFEYDSDGRKIPALPTLHPAYLLRQPAQKKLAWRDLLAIRARLG